MTNSTNNISEGLLPRFYRSDANKKFLQTTIDQLIQPGSVQKVSGFIGRQNSKATKALDNFIAAKSSTRQNYQVEPAVVIKDNLSYVNFFKDYQDYINQLNVLGANTQNHARLNQQEFYSWNPQIDWDKFVNFQNYYWSPNGPLPVLMAAQTDIVNSTFSVVLNNQGNVHAYLFSPKVNIEPNPTITLYRGQTYCFDITSPGNPFSIMAKGLDDSLYQYTDNVTGMSVESGIVTLVVTDNTPDTLYYQSEIDDSLIGEFKIQSVVSSVLDVEKDVLGKKNLFITNPVTLTDFKISNGMKIRFGEDVQPASYRNNVYYVEGIGDSLQLILEKSLEVFGTDFIDPSTNEINESCVTYVLINRSSSVFSLWSRYNKWVHKDVLVDSAAFNKDVADLSYKASRPIIEFNGELALFNYGTVFVEDIDLLDPYTKKINYIENKLGYYIDGYNLADLIKNKPATEQYVKVLFTGCTNASENNFIYRVTLVNDLLHIEKDAVIDTLDLNYVVLIKQGNTYANKVFWYTQDFVTNTNYWKPAQQKIISSESSEYQNQAPLFDVVTIIDEEIVSYSDIRYFKGSTFFGTKFFSYKINENGVVDPILNLKLSYKNIENSGDIVFKFDFESDTFSYKDENNEFVYKSVSTEYLTLISTNKTSLVNGWIKSLVTDVQPAIRIYKNTNVTTDEDKNAKDYVNGKTYYSGEIVRYYDGDLYQVKTDGTVSNIGTTESPPETVDVDVSSYTGNNTTTVTVTVNSTFRYFVGDIVTIVNSSISSLNGVWEINSVVDSTTFTFISSTPLGVGVYTNNLGIVTKSKNTQSWNFYGKSLLQVNNFDLDIFDNKNELNDLVVKVYVNDKITNNWIIQDGVRYKKIILDQSINYNDVLTIKANAAQPINGNGYYQIPINLQYNPLNDSIVEFTYGEIIDHTKSIIDNLGDVSSLRDLGSVAGYGTRFVQHTGPISLSLYHITSESNNIVRSIEQSREEYTKFKRNFITVAETLGADADTVEHVNLILQEINKNKPSFFPYYFSDMVPYGAYTKTDFTVFNTSVKRYPLTYSATVSSFNLTELSSRAVYVYYNGIQLIYNKDYVFDSVQNFVIIKNTLQKNSIISIYEYDTTDGCFIPETPTKLGLWPKYEPKKYLDTTLVTPKEMIQGHDGSLTLAYGDYRDDLILELEKRIYNNIKVDYDSSIFDINDILPRYNIDNSYKLEEFNEILSPSFYQWVSLVNKNFATPLEFDASNPWTFNYKNYSSLDGRAVPGYWRGIYQWLLGTDRPHLCPWEMLGFFEQPTWWNNEYGFDYSSNNLKMWSDVSLGIIREANKPVVRNSKYIKSFLLDHIPVNSLGELLDPSACGLVQGYSTLTENSSFVFGDVSPVEAAWRRNSHYPFSVINAAILMFPAKMFGVLLDRSRIVKNLVDQIIYKDTGVRVRPADIILPSTSSSTTRIQTSGIINYIINYIVSDKLKSLDSYANDLAMMSCQLSYRVGGFTSKEKFSLLLDSKSPLATGSIFVPAEDYDIFLNKSSPTKKVGYSGVIITKLQDGFEVNGYIRSQPYFKCYTGIGNGVQVNVGGISESYVNWLPNQFYNSGQIVKYNNKYYQVKIDHNSGSSFNIQYYQALNNLPVVGGRTANFKKFWNKSAAITVPYNTKFDTIQEVVDFLLGYGEWLSDQGFVFDQFSGSINQVLNWETSAKEFLFWTTQNWSTGEDKWAEWNPDTKIPYGTIVRYKGDYYKALRNVPISTEDPIYPDEDYHTIVINEREIQEVYYEKLDGLSTVGSSVISLSPCALAIVLNTELNVVDDVRNQFHLYEILSVNGTPIFADQLNFYRESNKFICTAYDDVGIYAATFYLVQKEQVVVLNNTTIFNDLIYSPSTGYKQDRIKVSGYVSTDWSGSFNVPGFIFDQANIQEWLAWTDYALGDMVKYKEFYYSANSFIPSSETFDAKKWVRLERAPTSKLIPNWSYKALQFTDFHSLDNDNFDASQQRLAQHLTGYQKRQYLDNIIKDDVSEFKFYQGMILEKGTQNVFDKLFNVLNRSDEESLEFYEEWALRTGRYGASSAYDTIEVVLDESQFKNNPQGFELVNSVDKTIVDFIIRKRLNDVYVRPTDTRKWPNIFPVLNNYVPVLRSAGSVDENDVSATFKTISDITNESVDRFNHGDYIWCTFDYAVWNVYKFILTKNRILNIEYIVADNNWKVSLYLPIKLDVGFYVGLKNLQNNGDGFYEVVGVDSNSIRIAAESSTFTFDSLDQENAQFIELVGQHINYFDDLADNSNGYKIFTKNLIANNLMWIGGIGDNPFATWKYQPVFSQRFISNYVLTANQEYGRELAVNKDNNILITTDKFGNIYVNVRLSSSTYWSQVQSIPKPTIYFDNDSLESSEYTKILAISEDGTWLASAAPLAENVLYVESNGLFVASSQGSASKSQGMVTIYQNINNEFVLVNTILSPLVDVDDSLEEFGSSLVFVGDELLIGASKFKNAIYDVVGCVYRLKYNSVNWEYHGTLPLDTEYSYGQCVAADSFEELVAVSNHRKVRIYKKVEDDYVQLYDITKSDLDTEFGRSISFSLEDNYLAISAVNDRSGVVYVYSLGETESTKLQTISNVFLDNVKGFGEKVSFIKNYNTTVDNHNSLVLFNKLDEIGYDSLNYDIPDYDNELLYYVYMGQRLINVYDNYFEKWVLSESLLDANFNTTGLDAVNGFGTSDDCIFIGRPRSLVANIDIGGIYEYRNKTNNKNFSWTLRSVQSAVVDSFKIKRAYLYNKRNNTLMSYLDVVDCLLGKIPGVADQEIKYKTYYDPAVYSDVSNLSNRSDLSESVYSRVVNGNVINIDNGLAWTKMQVGTIWWDLRTAKFIDIYSKTGASERDITYRNTMQNTLVTGASIDICEWVETRYKPSDWDRLADTEQGLAQGISGRSLYGDAAFCISRKFDTVSQSFNNTYYYWVKSKTTKPNISSRRLSADAIARLIANPRGQGYQYLSLIGTNAFNLVNVENSLLATDVVLAVEYWITDKINQNIHSEWRLISNEANSQIPKNIERKWFDSLCGRDSTGLIIPDPTLPIKLLYGIENRPLQSMFINRLEALKQVIEHANAVLKNYHITQYRDLSKLESFDQAPSNSSMLFDISVDTVDELEEIDVQNVRSANIKPVILNGRIVDIKVLDPGYGYIGKNPYKDPDGNIIGWYGPSLTILGIGKDASIILVIDDNGSLITTNQGVPLNLIINTGEGYLESNTSLVVRNFSALVNQDIDSQGNLINEWSIYSYNNNNQWYKDRSQTYNTRKYWKYVDWYVTGYNQYSIANYIIDTFVDLTSVNSEINELVKVRSDGADNWVLLKKYSTVSSVDWTTQYQVVGSQNGTIQFLESLYTSTSTVGYDGDLYDSSPYDSITTIEFRNILEALRDDILIDDLQVEYLNLFFISLRYAHSEQHYLDWAFKTSLIKAKHNVGAFTNRITYKSDNLESYEDYISEVKPYRTKIREYISRYNQLEQCKLSTTDFDLQPIFENGKNTVVYAEFDGSSVITDSSAILAYPWKNWYDNCIPCILGFNIINQGFNYTNIQLTLFGECISPAIIRPVLENGNLVNIEVVDPGKGYFKVPQVAINGDGYDAEVVAIIGSSARSPFIKMKFDRTSLLTSVDNIMQTEEFIGDNSTVSFSLQYAPSKKLNESRVLIKLQNNNYFQEIPFVRYELKSINKNVDDNNNVLYTGVITFKNTVTGQAEPPPANSIIKVQYYRDQSLLSATDRIQYYYNPTNTELGKSLNQLMTGVDYGGVVISSIDLAINKGWDTLPYYTERWGFSDDDFTDYTATITDVSSNFYSVKLPEKPPTNTVLNVYYVKSYISSQAAETNVSDYAFDPKVDVSEVWLTGTKTTVATVKNSLALNLSDITDINIGDIIELTGVVTEINSNKLIFSSTVGLAVDDLVKFNQGVFGGIQYSQYYYIHSISNNEVTLKLTIDSPAITGLIDGLGNMTYQVDGYISYNTRVVSKINVGVMLSNHIIKAIPTGMTVGIRRNLRPIHDFKIYNKGTISLLNPVSQNLTVNIKGYYKPIQVDDPNYGKSWAVTGILVSNLIYVNTTTTLKVGDPVRFSGNVYGNIVADTIYYVHSLVDNNFNFRISSKLGGTQFNLVQGFAGPMTVHPILDPYASMKSIVASGNTEYFNIPKLSEELFGTIVVGDQLIIRRSTSDGSIKPYDADYDTSISGGNLIYSTAQGIMIDDVIIDGDDFRSPVTTPGLEELVSGQLVDAVAIKVFDNPRVDTSLITANITVDTYITDGIDSSFRISQSPNSPGAVIVKSSMLEKVIKLAKIKQSVEVGTTIVNSIGNQGQVILVEDNNITYFGDDFNVGDIIYSSSVEVGIVIDMNVYSVFRIKEVDVDYTINYDTDYIEFINVPPANVTVSIFSVGFNGGILAVDYIQSTTESRYITKYPYSVTTYRTLLVYIDGQLQNSGVSFVENDNGALVVEFSNVPSISALISVILVENTDLNFAITNKQRFNGHPEDYQGDKHKFLLTYVIGEAAPIEHSMIVRVDQKILSPLLGEYEYLSNSSEIRFDEIYTNDNLIEVISSYKHDILDIVRFYTSSELAINYAPNTPDYYHYTNVASGLIRLDRAVVDSNYVWVTRNNILLIPDVDYKLNADHSSIQITSISDPADKFDVITYGTNLSQDTGIAYMQFKDMLNRTHFKRLNAYKQTRLAKELKYNDTVIELEDASNFEIPDRYQNKPGIIEIYGERIEYFTITGNKLGKLRRGTLGTGTLSVYEKGTIVQDIGSEETIPYIDSVSVEKASYQSSKTILLDQISNVVENTVIYKTTPVGNDAELKSMLAKNSVDVFVGGYEFPVTWEPDTNYKVDDIVILEPYTYRCIENHTSSTDFRNDYDFNDSSNSSNKWKYFVTNIHLKKDSYSIHNSSKNRISPLGDIDFDADFTVNDSSITLSNGLLFGTSVYVVKRTGLDWDSYVNIQDPVLNESTREISDFINAVPGVRAFVVKS